ncbi:MAG: hypothetical protein KJ941_07485 [Bacteroidetes bacterium]|nr:hypothetical protein [Bacteroidota bacterium]
MKNLLRAFSLKKKFVFLFLFSPITLLSQWQIMSPYPGLGKDDAIAFSIGKHGFLTTGNNGGFQESNFVFRYSVDENSWLKLNDFPGPARQYAGRFVINDLAYIVGGIEPNGTILKDVWEYTASSDSWKKLNDFPGAPRWSMAAFAVLGNGYLGTGTNGVGFFKDFWRYNPKDDTWTQLPDFGGHERRESAFFTIGEKAYVGLGYSVDQNANKTIYSDFYSFQVLTSTWKAIDTFPGGELEYAEGIGNSSVGMVIGGINESNQFSKEVYILNENEHWIKTSDSPIGPIKGSSTFSIENHLYSVSGIKEDYQRTNSLMRFTSEILQNNLFIYPNPTDGLLVVKGKPKTTLVVTDVVGKTFMQILIPEEGVVAVEMTQKGWFWISELENPKKSLSVLVR